MIVLARRVAGRFGAQFARHAQMQSQPAVPGKPEKHLFAVRFRTQQNRSRQGPPQSLRVGAAQQARVRVQFDGENLLPPSALPLLAIKFHFGQFRHGGNVKTTPCPGNAHPARQQQ